MYFGFTNCPDICPEELDKMTEVVKRLGMWPINSNFTRTNNLYLSDELHGEVSQPIFISVDPARDTQLQIARYLKDFHPRLVGLSGTYDETKAVCKTYRVYFSTPKDASPDGDYLVDHSIYFYLMDPEGEFVEAFGRSSTAEEVVKRTDEEISRWESEKGRKT